MPKKIPSPDDAPQLTARELLDKIRESGGRIYRMREVFVFCITDDEFLAAWLSQHGARSYLPAGASKDTYGAFTMSKGGKRYWDMYVHTIPVLGAQSIWEAAGELAAEPYEVGDQLPYNEEQEVA